MELLHEKTGSTAGTLTLCHPVLPGAWQTTSLQKPELEKRASKMEQELWERQTSLTELSQADPEAS